MRRFMKNIEINFTAEVLTRETAAQVFIAIYELLLFQRNTIPFVYQTFKYLASRLPDPEDDSEIHFDVQRQISLAQKTLSHIEHHFELILNTFKSRDVQEMRILFGSTPVTPKEVWVLKCPEISTNHFNENHRNQAELLVKSILMQLVITEDICDHFASKPLPQTNVFLEFGIMGSLTPDESKYFTEKDPEEICSPSVVTLDLVRSGTFQPNCCMDLEIAEGVGRIYLEKLEKKETGTSLSTFEVNEMIKGYKDRLVKGKSIWEWCGKK